MAAESQHTQMAASSGWELDDDTLKQLGILTASQPEAEAGWEVPPAIEDLFVHYNSLYFESKLGFCSVEWSTGRMTLCAGVCCFSNHGGCRIKLSEPLLKYRPLKDLKETLLHEMIHAYNFLEGIRDRDAHGPTFLSKMHAINASRVLDQQRPPGGYNITTHHTMHDEVDLYRVHHWQCQSCGNLIKRAMNRRPQPADCRGFRGKGDACEDPHCLYHIHLRRCGGEYLKINGPDLDGTAGSSKPKKPRTSKTAAAGTSTGVGSSSKATSPAQAQLGQGGGGSAEPQANKGPGVQPITRFFHKAMRAPVQVSNVNGAAGTLAGPQGGAGAVSGGQPVEDDGRRRQRCLDAALQRFDAGASSHEQGTGGLPVQQQQQQPVLTPPSNMHPVNQPAVTLGARVIDLVDSDDGEDTVAHAALPLHVRHVQPAGVPVPSVVCPVCCMSWPVGSISNAELDRHLHACLG